MGEKKQILFVMDGLKIGGVESSLAAVLQRIDYQQFDVDLLLLHNHMGMEAQISKNVTILNFELESKRTYSPAFVVRYVFFRLLTMLNLKASANKAAKAMQHCSRRLRCKKLLTKKYDTVIAYKQGEAEDFVAFCIDAEKKIAFYHHGSLVDEWLHDSTFAHFDKIAAVSIGVQSMLQARYPKYASKIVVVPNYIDAETIVKRAEEYTADVSQNCMLLCSVGRLCREKRFDRVMDTASILRDKGIRFHWFIIGDGEQRTALNEQIAQKQLSDYVVLTGAIPNPLPYVKQCDIYVQTSDAESYGLAIQEALVLGKLVVSTKTIGGELLIQHKINGYLSSDSAEDIAAGIFWCRSHSDYLRDQTGFEQYERMDCRTMQQWVYLLS